HRPLVRRERLAVDLDLVAHALELLRDLLDEAFVLDLQGAHANGDERERGGRRAEASGDERRGDQRRRAGGCGREQQTSAREGDRGGRGDDREGPGLLRGEHRGSFLPWVS